MLKEHASTKPALRPVRDDHRSATALLSDMNRLPEGDSRREVIRSQIVDLHLPVAKSIANRYARRGEPLEDIQQAAFLGLVKAINRFDPAVGDNFLAYATPMMVGEVKRHFRDRTWSLRMPRPLQELGLAMTPVVRDFVHRNGRYPTTAEIAEAMNLSEAEAADAIVAWASYRPVSLDVPAGEDEDAAALGDNLGREDPALESLVDGQALRPLIDELPERDRTILLLRYFGNKTQSEIGAEIGLSQMHVSRLLRRSLERLRIGLTVEE